MVDLLQYLGKNKNGKFESDSSSFLFSLNNKEKYLLKNKNDNKAIYHSNTCGPAFGNNQKDLYIPDNCFSDNDFVCYSNSYIFDNKKMYGGKESFLIEDYEVYLVNNK